MRYWLFKSEPSTWSWDDQVAKGDEGEEWDGVRNYQARNFMRDDMQIGDGVLFYHSGKKPQVVGTARIVRPGYPDHTAWDPDSNHYDPKSSPENPIWFMVDIRFESEFKRPLTLKELRAVPDLEDMILLRRGNRLSVMPVTPQAYALIVELADRT